MDPMKLKKKFRKAKKINLNFMKSDKTVEIKDNKALVEVNPEVYSLDAIYGAAYNFLEDAYIYLQKKGENILIQLKSQENNSEEELKKLAEDFLNELITVGLRLKISEKNKKLREYIISAALVGASDELKEDINNFTDEESDEGWEEDPLGIATPWEEEHEE